MSNKDFFIEDNPSNIFLNKSQERVQEINLIINNIRKFAPISIWDLAKKLQISNSKLYYILRDLEFAGVIFSKVKLNENNRSVRMIYIKKILEAKK